MDKTDNSNIEAKVQLRNLFLSTIQTPSILECFAGEQRILYNACYKNYPCISLDKKKIDGVLCIDNKKFIASRDLSKFNFFDLDAYGSPYDLLLNIFKKKHKEDSEFCIIVTDGLARNLGYGDGGKLIQTVINNYSRIRIPCLNDYHEFIIKILLKKLSSKYHIEISYVKIVREESTNRMYYYGMLCKSGN